MEICLSLQRWGKVQTGLLRTLANMLSNIRVYSAPNVKQYKLVYVKDLENINDDNSKNTFISRYTKLVF